MDEFLIIAYSLAILTYYLGVLIYLLPIPVWSVKKWAPALIYDSFAVTILVLLFTSIIEATSYFGGILGVSWDFYFNWLVERIAVLGSFISLLISVSLAISQAGGRALVTSFLGPITSIATYTLIVMEFFFVLGLVFKEYFAKILAFGILLYAVPFRLARSAGASLIALSIVFTIALPLLPTFVNVMSVSESSPLTNMNISEPLKPKEDLGVFFAKGIVKDITGEPIPYIKTEWFLKENSIDPIATYYTDENGFYNAGRPFGGLPAKVNGFYVKFSYLGISISSMNVSINEFFYNPYLDPNADYVHDFTLNNVIYFGRTVLLILQSEVKNAEVNKQGNTYVLNIVLNGPQEAIIAYVPEVAKITKLKVNYSEIEFTNKSYIWNNVNVSTINFHLPKGSTVIEVSYVIVGEENIQLVDKGYFSDIDNTLNSSINVQNLGEAIGKVFFQWIILPVTYLTILISITYSFAYTLGGRKLRLPIRDRV